VDVASTDLDLGQLTVEPLPGLGIRGRDHQQAHGFTAPRAA
jgi:hypothetical protein